jgi:hypothetical protein
VTSSASAQEQSTKEAEPPTSVALAPTPATMSSAPAPTRVSAVEPTLARGNECCSQYGWSAGASLYLLKPYFSSTPAFVTISGAGTANQTVDTTPFDWDLQMAPAFWLSWTGANCCGVRARYFHFDDSSNTLGQTLTAAQVAGGALKVLPPSNLILPGGVPNFGSAGVLLGLGAGQDVLGFNSRLEIQTLDVEATWHLERGQWLVQLAAGGRYLNMEQNYTATLANDVAGASERQTLTFDHDFSGGGPTLALQASYQIARLSLFGNVRGSLLVGQTQSRLNFVQVITDPAGAFPGVAQTSNPSARQSDDTVLPVLELELGLEYALTAGRYRTFLRGAVVNQTYFNAGNASSTEGDLGLFGAQFSLGVNF